MPAVDLSEIAKLGMLRDLYEGLLPPRQREVARLKLDEDLSFSEIASELGISRGAAQDAFHSCIEALQGFERRVGFLAYVRETSARLRRIRVLLEAMNESNWDSLRTEVLAILRQFEAVDGG